MRIYCGKNKLTAKQTSLIDLMRYSLKKCGIESKKGEFSDNSQSWIEIDKITNKPSRVQINVLFDADGNLEGFSVFEAEIVTIIDEENQRQIVRIQK